MNGRTFVLAALVAAILPAPRAAAHDAQRDQMAGEVLAAARNAIVRKGGLPDTLTVEGTLQRSAGRMQLDSEVEVLLQLPDKYLRIERPRGALSGGMTTGFNGDRLITPAGAAVLPGGGMMIRVGPGGAPPPDERLSPEEQAAAEAGLRRNARAEISRLMLGWFAAVHPALPASYAYGGEAESPDGRAHVIDVTGEDGFSARLFIDQATRLPLMVTYRGPQPRIVSTERPGAGRAQGSGGESARTADEARRQPSGGTGEQLRAVLKEPAAVVDHTLYFDDWRDAGGMLFPHTIRRAAAGETIEEWTVTRVRVNPRLDARQCER